MQDREVLAAIGEVVVDATVLEWHVAALVAAIEGRDRDYARELAGNVGRTMPKLKEHASASPDLQRLYHDAKAVLDDRNSLIHSVALFTVEDDGAESYVHWYPRTDKEAHITVPQIREHAHDIRIASRRVIRAIDARTRAAQQQ